MKQLTAIVFVGLMSVTGLSQANPNHYRGHHHHHHQHGGWIAPLVIGSVVGYAIANRPQPAPTPPVVYYPNTYPPVPVGYRWDQVLDANCNCYRWVLVPNQ